MDFDVYFNLASREWALYRPVELFRTLLEVVRACFIASSANKCLEIHRPSVIVLHVVNIGSVCADVAAVEDTQWDLVLSSRPPEWGGTSLPWT
jgi:hypothetical protein